MAYKYPICDVYHWFCKIARFFATEPGMLMSSNFEQLKTDIFTFGDNSLYKGDKINYRIKNKDQFIRRFLRDNPIYKNETHVVLRQVITHIRTNIWNKLSDMDRYGTIRRPVWDVVTNEEDVFKTLDLLTEKDVQTHTCPEELEEFLQYFTNWIRKSSIPITISNI